MATKCTRHHPSRSFYGLALSRRAFSPTLKLVERHKTLDECAWVSRFPTYFPSPSDLRRRLSPSVPPPPPQSGFFSPVSAARRLQPRNAHRRPRGWRRRESGKEGTGRRTSCYICNVFAFTIFQLVCILEPLLLASTLVPSIFFSLSPPPPSSLCSSRHWWMLHFTSFPPPGPSPSRRNSFIRIFTRVASPKTTRARPAKDSIFSNNPENAIEGS